MSLIDSNGGELVPYGIKKSLGGDTAATDARVARCVQDLQQQGHSKLSAILICKASIQRSLGNRKKGS